MKKILFVVILTLSSSLLQAQSINYIGVMPTIDHSGKLHKKWSYNAYIFAMNKPYSSTELVLQDDARFIAFYAEAGISYHFSDKLSFTNAYLYERQNPFREDYRNENRLYQQLTLQLPLTEKTKLKQRLRFDERFIQNRFTNKTDFSHRIRYLLGISQNLSEKLYMFGYSEVFFHTTNDFFYEENWTALQIGYKVNEKNAIEAGFLLAAWLIDREAKAWQNNYLAQITWVSKLDFTKKKMTQNDSY